MRSNTGTRESRVIAIKQMIPANVTAIAGIQLVPNDSLREIAAVVGLRVVLVVFFFIVLTFF
jgi:hypothetical protein